MIVIESLPAFDIENVVSCHRSELTVPKSTREGTISEADCGGAVEDELQPLPLHRTPNVMKIIKPKTPDTLIGCETRFKQ